MFDGTVLLLVKRMCGCHSDMHLCHILCVTCHLICMNGMVSKDLTSSINLCFYYFTLKKFLPNKKKSVKLSYNLHNLIDFNRFIFCHGRSTNTFVINLLTD